MTLKKNPSPKIKAIAFVFTVAIVSLALSYFVLAWSEPSGSFPTGNVALPINVSPNAQIKAGDLSVAALYDANDSTYFVNPDAPVSALLAGNVGIGTASPEAKLDVSGSVYFEGGCGDINNDGECADAGDLAMMVNYLTGAMSFSKQQFSQADVDGDGRVTYDDLGILKEMSVGIAKDIAKRAVYGGYGMRDTNMFYIRDNVGIGTANPEFKLSLDNDGGIIAKGTFGSGADLTTSGWGTRLIWYPKKAAFRAGRVWGSEWDNANVGIDSFAVGMDAVASGSGSFAGGFSPEATGNNSVAIGPSLASGHTAVALGSGNTASGSFSFAIGNSSVAGGTTAIAMGSNGTRAAGDGSIALGVSAWTNNTWAVAIGTNVRSNGFNSFVLGKGTSTPGQELSNNIDNSLMVGFNSDIPTLFVGPSSGAGTTGNVGIGTTSPTAKLEVNGGVRLNTTAGKPACDATKRGTLWFAQGVAGVKDSLEVCAKDAADAYAWRTIY